MIYNVLQCGEPEGTCGGGPIEIRLGLGRPFITPYSLKTQAKNRFNHLILMRAQIQHAERGGGVRGGGGFQNFKLSIRISLRNRSFIRKSFACHRQPWGPRRVSLAKNVGVKIS